MSNYENFEQPRAQFDAAVAPGETDIRIPEELAILTIEAQDLWAAAAKAPADAYPGFKTSMTKDGRAEFRHTFSPAAYNQIAIFKKAGVWYIERQDQAPTLETEAASTVRKTVTHPLALEDWPVTTHEYGDVGSDSIFVPTQKPDSALGKPLSFAGCANLRATLKEIVGPTKREDQSRRPMRRGWLGRLLGKP
jgi:hypothetical protein